MAVNNEPIDNNLGLSAFVTQAMDFLKEYKVGNDKRIERVEEDIRNIFKEFKDLQLDSLKEDKDIEMKVKELINTLEIKLLEMINKTELDVALVAKEQKIKTVRWTLVGNVLTLLAAALMFLVLNHYLIPGK